MLLDLDRPTDAEPHLRAVRDAYQKAGPTDIRTVQVAGKLGACLLALKRYDDAEPLLVEYFETIAAQPGACLRQSCDPPVSKSSSFMMRGTSLIKRRSGGRS